MHSCISERVDTISHAFPHVPRKTCCPEHWLPGPQNRIPCKLHCSSAANPSPSGKYVGHGGNHKACFRRSSGSFTPRRQQGSRLRRWTAPCRIYGTKAHRQETAEFGGYTTAISGWDRLDWVLFVAVPWPIMSHPSILRMHVHFLHLCSTACVYACMHVCVLVSFSVDIFACLFLCRWMYVRIHLGMFLEHEQKHMQARSRPSHFIVRLTACTYDCLSVGFCPSDSVVRMYPCT